MAQEKRNRLVEWVELLRKQAPVVRQAVDDWLNAVREEPRLIWETTAIRYTTYGVGGLVILWVTLGIVHSVAPPPPAAARPEATTADFHVVCTSEGCGHHFVIHRKLGFKKFPVVCPDCKRETGMQARRCYSPTCEGRWIAPRRTNGAVQCPHCGQHFQQR